MYSLQQRLQAKVDQLKKSFAQQELSELSASPIFESSPFEQAPDSKDLKGNESLVTSPGPKITAVISPSWEERLLKAAAKRQGSPPQRLRSHTQPDVKPPSMMGSISQERRPSFGFGGM